MCSARRGERKRTLLRGLGFESPARNLEIGCDSSLHSVSLELSKHSARMMV